MAHGSSATFLRRTPSGRHRRVAILSGLVVAAALAVVPVTASANHSWGSYHWATSSLPFTLKLGNNLTGNWTTSPYGGTYLGNISSDWSVSSVLDTTIATGAGLKRCGAVNGRVEVCNDTYGRNGWLGVASIWASGSHITKATVKVNDTYYTTAAYNTQEWRRSVLCQEVGHTFGLGHQSEDPTVNTGSCMDYYQVPNIAPNVHDYAQLQSIYGHTGETATVSSAATTTRRGLVRVREGIYVEDFGDGRRRVVFVSWQDQDQQHLAAPAGV